MGRLRSPEASDPQRSWLDCRLDILASAALNNLNFSEIDSPWCIVFFLLPYQTFWIRNRVLPCPIQNFAGFRKELHDATSEVKQKRDCGVLFTVSH
jgi:hypothetical protein